VVDGQTGMLVPVGDCSAMSEAIRVLLKDTPLRERMGQAGRARVEEQFSKERSFAQYRDLYRSIKQYSPQRHRVHRVRSYFGEEI
jgi:glycosyltransferase involved in cell wall biosynthesis